MTSSAVVLAATVIKVSFFKVPFLQYITYFESGVAQKLNLGFAAILKVPKCEIFDRSDFNDFYTIKSLGGRLWG
jgi:hypothetical protein